MLLGNNQGEVNIVNEFVHDGVTVQFGHVSGTVLSSKKYSETHVSSSGGGGHVGRRGGYVAAPKVHSRVVTRHEFWLRKLDGTEQVFQFTNRDIALREGQQVSLLIAARADAKQSWYAELVNHDARNRTAISTLPELTEHLQLNEYTPQSFVKLALLLAGAWLAIHFGSGLLGLATFGAFVYIAMKRQMRNYSAQRALATHLAGLANTVLASRTAIFG